jgi:acyl dehydratase
MVNQQTRVREDGSGLRTTFDQIEVGESLGSIRWSVTREAVQGLIDNDDDHNEWYDKDSPFGGPIVPPLATYPPVRMLLTRVYNIRGLFYEYEGEFLLPIHYGDEITVTAWIADKWVKRDREYFAYEGEGRNDAGELVFRTRRTHVLDFITRDAPREGKGIDSGVLTVPGADTNETKKAS